MRIPGDAVSPLSCQSRCDVTDVTWYHDNMEVTPDNIKYTMTNDNGLAIFNVSEADTGNYQCRSGSVVLARHNVQLDAGKF